MRSAGAMYLVGRVFASGARLYLATIAVSMLIFGDIAVESIVSAAALLTLLGFLLTFLGGIRSIIWSDALQCLVYVSAAIAVVWFLLTQIPSDIGTIAAQLQGDGADVNKLTLFNWSLDFSQPFSMSAILVGFFLLGVASFGLDQDMTQRVLTCKDERSGRRALYLSALLGIPVVALFLVIGLLLHVFYERPDLMTTSTATLEPTFSGEVVTVFMYYILSELPTGLKGLVVAGVVAAALSTLNSGMNSMSSVLVKDFYLPILRKEKLTSPEHVVTAGRIGMAVVGLSLFLMSVLCFYWQRYTDMPLLEFALSVMVFAYSGLLGVYFTAIFTNRGSGASVIAALIVGFLATLVQQAYIVDATLLPAQFKALAFPWQLAIGASLSFMVCALPTGKETQTKSPEKLDAA
jgi:Na+/proline symporter